MARIINVEKSKYINDVIKMYADIKVGQYSKFLDKLPIFVTYFAINQAMSRADVGTGGINSELGSSSPIRYNRINNLPVYNLPELRPDVEYDETGIDIDIDLTDLTLLPGTIRPKAGDYFLVMLPGTKEFLFRVNNFRYNTIQSNDFYQFDADLKDIGTNLIEKNFGKNQIVESYETIFENIGTENKCFIRTDDVSKIEAIGKLFNEMKEFYYNNFFDTQSGSFVLKNNEDDPDYLFYDMYLNKFISESEIYYSDTGNNSLYLPCNDLAPSNMDALYSRTLLYAVLNNTTSYLANYVYYYRRDITKPLSPFVINRVFCKGVNLIIRDNEIDPSSPDYQSGFIKHYYSKELIEALKSSGDPYTTDSYLEEIIYNFLNNNRNEIDGKKLIQYMISDNLYSYMYMPLIMYIVLKYYDSYFTKIEL